MIVKNFLIALFLYCGLNFIFTDPYAVFGLTAGVGVIREVLLGYTNGTLSTYTGLGSVVGAFVSFLIDFDYVVL